MTQTYSTSREMLVHSDHIPESGWTLSGAFPEPGRGVMFLHACLLGWMEAGWRTRAGLGVEVRDTLVFQLPVVSAGLGTAR